MPALNPSPAPLFFHLSGVDNIFFRPVRARALFWMDYNKEKKKKKHEKET